MRPNSDTRIAAIFRSILASLVLLLALPGTSAANDKVAEVKNLGTILVFEPFVEYEQLILTVTGPCNFEFRKVYEGETPAFKLNEETIDGIYNYSLKVIPRIDSGIIEILQQARKLDDNKEVNQLCREGKLPGAPATQGEGFRVADGKIAFEPGTSDNKAFNENGNDFDGGEIPFKDFVINDDLIVDGSACIGFDCVNGESFGFDTIRLKENNLRIKFDDTSIAASFPRTDWQLTANASANGGASKFSIDDISGNRTPFTVEANARSHSLYVDDGGRIGNRTSTPSTEIHTIDGDTPTLRLQQDGSSGFAPQTWDVAGNETNFFIRDVSNGSTLPFRIRPGAPTSSIFTDVDGDIGLGTASPGTLEGGTDASLHVVRSDGEASILVEETSGTTATREMLELRNNGQVQFRMRRSDNNSNWLFGASTEFTINNQDPGQPGNEFLLTGGGNLTIKGSLFTAAGNTCDIGCDRVFQPDYVVESIEDHAAYMWENSHLKGVGPTSETGLVNINKTTGGILNELEKAHIYIERLNDQVKTRDSEIEALHDRLSRLEGLLSGAAN